MLDPPAAPPVAPEAPRADDRALRRFRVLIVDDDPLVGRTIARLMRAHRVTTVTSGAEALATLALDDKLDVILCDLMMPGMSGSELASVIEERHQRLRNRMVFVTGGAVTQEATGFLARPDVRWVAKPVRYAELALRVCEIVEQADRLDAERSRPPGAAVNVSS